VVCELELHDGATLEDLSHLLDHPAIVSVSGGLRTRPHRRAPDAPPSPPLRPPTHPTFMGGLSPHGGVACALGIASAERNPQVFRSVSAGSQSSPLRTGALVSPPSRASHNGMSHGPTLGAQVPTPAAEHLDQQAPVVAEASSASPVVLPEFTPFASVLTVLDDPSGKAVPPL
jgi:hypothetical protein